MTEPYLHPRRRRAILTWSTADIALGLTLLASSPQRTSSPALNTAKSIAPLPAWGLVMLTLGILWTAAALLAHLIAWPLAGWLIGLPAALLAGWHLFFWMSLCFAAAHNPNVGLAGCILYLAIAVNHLLFAVDQV